MGFSDTFTTFSLTNHDLHSHQQTITILYCRTLTTSTSSVQSNSFSSGHGAFLSDRLLLSISVTIRSNSPLLFSLKKICGIVLHAKNLHAVKVEICHSAFLAIAVVVIILHRLEKQREALRDDPQHLRQWERWPSHSHCQGTDFFYFVIILLCFSSSLLCSLFFALSN